MKTWSLVLVAVAAFAGGSIAACSTATTPTPSNGDDGSGGGNATTTGAGGGSSTATTTTNANGGSGQNTTTTSANGGSGQTTSTTDTTTDTGTGGSGQTTTSCHPPTSLHPPKAGKPSIFCPFSSVDGGKNEYCTAQTQHCCEPKSGTASCEDINTACQAGDTDWQCEDPVADCPQGQVCCGIGQFVQNADPNCANYAKGFKGTHCAASCDPATEVEMCTSDGECNGKTCKPMYTKGNQVGACD
jgi:hypothetical protein